MPSPCDQPHVQQFAAPVFERYKDLVGELVSRRRSLGLSQEDVGAASGLADGHVNKLEALHRIAQFPTLQLWVSTLGMELTLVPAPMPNATIAILEERPVPSRAGERPNPKHHYWQENNMPSHFLDIPKGPSFKGLRLAPTTIEAIEAMAYEGVPLRAAADRFDIRQSNLRRSFENPRVKVVYHALLEHIRQNVGQEAYMRIVVMSQTAKSETVRADCNKWLAGVDNIAPVKRVEASHQHSVKFGGFEYQRPEEKDITPDEDGDQTAIQRSGP